MVVASCILKAIDAFYEFVVWEHGDGGTRTGHRGIVAVLTATGAEAGANSIFGLALPSVGDHGQIHFSMLPEASTGLQDPIG
jgi:hypothetical protein